MPSNNDLDFKLLSLQLIRETRGSLSQAKLNEKMNFCFNQVSKWEIGRTAMKWSEYYDFAKHCDKPMDSILKKIFWTEGKEGTSSHFFPLLIGSQSIELVMKDYSISHSTVSRWIHGRSEPKLVDVLKAVHLYGSGLAKFFRDLLGERTDEAFPNLVKRVAHVGFIDAKHNSKAIASFDRHMETFKRDDVKDPWVFSYGHFAMNAEVYEKIRVELANLNWKIIRHLRQNTGPKDMSVVIGLQMFESNITEVENT